MHILLGLRPQFIVLSEGLLWGVKFAQNFTWEKLPTVGAQTRAQKGHPSMESPCSLVPNHVFKRKCSCCEFPTPLMLRKQDSTNLYNSTLLPHLRGDLWSRGTFHSVLTFIMLLDLILLLLNGFILILDQCCQIWNRVSENCCEWTKYTQWKGK